MFTPSDVQKVVYVVDASRAAETLEFLRGKRKQGRPTGLTTRLFLIGALLSALEGDGMVLKNIYDVLTRRMDFQWQVRLGIRSSVCAAPTFTQDAVDRLSVSIRDVLECGEDSASGVPAAERADRRDALLDVIDSMLDVTLIPTRSSYRSIDATGVWAWGKSPRSGGAKALAKEADALAAAGHADDAAALRLRELADHRADRARRGRDDDRLAGLRRDDPVESDPGGDARHAGDAEVGLHRHARCIDLAEPAAAVGQPVLLPAEAADDHVALHELRMPALDHLADGAADHRVAELLRLAVRLAVVHRAAHVRVERQEAVAYQQLAVVQRR